MGDYTGLRFKGIVKEEFVQLIKELTEEFDWQELSSYYPQYGFLKEYSECNRADFIPNGAYMHVPIQWEGTMFTNGFVDHFNEETRVWSFQCNLKNHDETIQQFFKLIVSNVIEKSIHIETYYEYDARSDFYELKDGKVVESDKEGILYGTEDGFIKYYTMDTNW